MCIKRIFVVLGFIAVCCACSDVPGNVPTRAGNDLPAEMAYFPLFNIAGDYSWEIVNTSDDTYQDIFIERYYPDAMENHVDYYTRLMIQKNFTSEGDNDSGGMIAHDSLNDEYYEWTYYRHPDTGFLMSWWWVLGAEAMLDSEDSKGELPGEMAIFPAFSGGSIAWETDKNEGDEILIERSYPEAARVLITQYVRLLKAKGFTFTGKTAAQYYRGELQLRQEDTGYTYRWSYELDPEAGDLDAGFILRWQLN